MFTRRVLGAGTPTIASAFAPHDAELLIVYPPPRTPNLPATAGLARIAVVAGPPLRFRSWPQPQRITAGDASAYQSTNRDRSSAGTPDSAAALTKVHSEAACRSSSAPVA